MCDTEIFSSSRSSFAVRLYARADACAHAIVSAIILAVFMMMPSLTPSTLPNHHIYVFEGCQKNGEQAPPAFKASVNDNEEGDISLPDVAEHVSPLRVGAKNKSTPRKNSFSSRLSRRFAFTRRPFSMSHKSAKAAGSDVLKEHSSDEGTSEKCLSRRSSFSSIKSTWSFHGRRRLSISSSPSPPPLETIFSASNAPSQCAPISSPVMRTSIEEDFTGAKYQSFNKKWLAKFKTPGCFRQRKKAL